MTDEQYDIVIVGSGLGGLACGVMLAKEGMKVCVVEQGALFGGCLQSFRRAGHTIDTGMHYLGSMERGQIMDQYLRYFGVRDKIDTLPLDNAFDHLTLGSHGTFVLRQSYDSFYDELAARFPHERKGLRRYCEVVQHIGSSINVDVHRTGQISRLAKGYHDISATAFVEEHITDPMLRAVLFGSNILCGSSYEHTNLYHHAMITHSNIEGAHRFICGSQQLPNALCHEIEGHGGVLLNRSRVTHFTIKDDQISGVMLADGRHIKAKRYISNLHPATTFAMVEPTRLIKKAYRSRLSLLPNTYGIFSVYLTLKPRSLRHINHNRYLHHDDNVWDNVMRSLDHLPAIMISTQCTADNIAYADVVTLMTPVDTNLFAPYAASTFGHRPAGYTTLKAQIAEQMIALALQHYPELASSIDHIYTASPLTYAHYTATPQGSAYGIDKRYSQSLATHFGTRTKIPNLLLTGQNINVHGAIGVTLTAAATCSELLGMKYLSKKIAAV